MSYFVALTIPDDVQVQFVKRTNSLAGYFKTIHPVHPHQHHITLAFLGELSKAELEQTKQVLDDIHGYQMRFETAGLDRFAHGVLIQKLKKEPQLYTLQKKVIRAFEKAGIYYDQKPFYPHITLAGSCTCDTFHSRAWLSGRSSIEILIDTMTLMRSQRGIYHVVQEFPLKPEPTQYVYLLKCGDGSYYTGWTNHLEARVRAHQSGQGAKYTKSHQPVELVYYEEYADKRTAMRREYACKQMSRKEKEQLIQKMQLQKG